MKELLLTQKFESTAVNTFKLSDRPPIFVAGEGPWLFTEKKERYLDLVCGSATTNLGHNHPSHQSAIKKAMESGIFHTGTRLISYFRAELYSDLSYFLGSEDISIHLANSGSEAIETAIKLSRFLSGKEHIIAFEGGYHGRTLGALSATHSEKIRLPFIGKMGEFVSFSKYPRKETEIDTCLKKCDELFQQQLEKKISVAAILVEPIQGVAGVWGPFPAFLEGLQKLAERYNCMLIVDEIWSGIGRSGKKFSFQYSNITPDLIVIGKGLSASLPLSAVIARGDLLKKWTAGAHTSTFQGNPVACAAASATLKEIEEAKLIEHVNKIIVPCFAKFASELRNIKNVLEVRFVGAQCAIAFENSYTANQIQHEAIKKNKILTYGGGLSGECVMIIPPINISEKILSTALTQLLELISEMSNQN